MDADFLRAYVESAWMIVALPFFVGFGIIACYMFGGLKIGEKRLFKSLAMIASIGAVTWGFFHSLFIFEALRVEPELNGWQQNWDWFTCANFKLSVGVLVDNLASMMLIVVTTVSLFVQIYTHGYMREDPGYARFYAYLSLFTGSMLGLVVSTNMFQMYGFWELVGVCSYFLIGFWWYKNSAAEACLKAFVVNRVGDFAFLVGILMLLLATKDLWAGGTVMAFVDPAGGGLDLTGTLNRALESGALSPAFALSATSLPLMAILIFGGPIAKSAQFPLHVWLPDAMEGPTPISALIHAATMVAAGIYLVARAYAVFLNPDGTTDSIALNVVAMTGTITAVMAATIAMSQNDVKRVLAWSTCSQLGYMMAGLGFGAFSAGLFHLFTHAFFKAMLFLGSGAVILGCHHEQDIRKMGGLRKVMPFTAFTFLIGTLSISGFPFMSGWFSKDEIVSAAFHNPNHFGMGVLLIITAGMTAFYMFRLYFLVFEGSYRGKHPAHEVTPVMWVPLVCLAVPSIAAGAILGYFPDMFKGVEGVNAWSSFIYFQHPHVEVANLQIMGISTGVALLGIVVSYLMYIAKSIDFNKKLVESKNIFWRISYNKWYFDEIYGAIVIKGMLPFFNKVWKLVDSFVIDNIVDGCSLITNAAGEVLKYTQNGRGQSYALVIFMWVLLLTWIVYMSPFVRS